MDMRWNTGQSDEKEHLLEGFRKFSLHKNEDAVFLLLDFVTCKEC